MSTARAAGRRVGAERRHQRQVARIHTVVARGRQDGWAATYQIQVTRSRGWLERTEEQRDRAHLALASAPFHLEEHTVPGTEIVAASDGSLAWQQAKSFVPFRLEERALPGTATVAAPDGSLVWQREQAVTRLPATVTSLRGHCCRRAARAQTVYASLHAGSSTGVHRRRWTRQSSWACKLAPRALLAAAAAASASAAAERSETAADADFADAGGAVARSPVCGSPQPCCSSRHRPVAMDDSPALALLPRCLHFSFHVHISFHHLSFQDHFSFPEACHHGLRGRLFASACQR